ncbi:DUF1073 domain-containing protein [Vibrio lentus]|uniref:phage portal protein n=3 Tax=Vibrio lentus TaxID=136468 RepID=UPI001D04D61E|nr:DUF1073 domain-containing protein [Vibrio lentus]MCB5464565.1 DUF1073 domain-containing protein [Vibrio lentus]MCC4849646.1 DUF1073 domain-containing protein [Vibrio lentus]
MWNNFGWVWPWGQEARDRRAFRALDNIYRTNWVARKAIDMAVEDMFKPWRTWDKAHQKAMNQAEKKHKIKRFYTQSQKYADLYGGLIIVPFLRGQDNLEEPLDLSSIQKGDLVKFVMFDRWYVGKQEVNYNEPLKDNYLRPEFYTLPTASKHQLRVHYSRVTELSGLEIPLHLKRSGILWGDSRLVPILDSVNQYTRAVDSASKLIDEQTIDILKQEQFSESMTTEQQTEIEKKADFVRSMKSSMRMLFADKKDEFDRKSIQMSGVAPTLEIIQEDISGAIRAPVTLFFGKAKAGMSGDTNDGDIRNWNGYLNTRLGEVEDNMSLVDEILIRDTLGSYPDDIEYTWKPLDVLTETERAKAKKDNVDAAKGAIESQIIAPEEARQLFEDDPDFSLDETKYSKHVAMLQTNKEHENTPENTKE